MDDTSYQSDGPTLAIQPREGPQGVGEDLRLRRSAATATGRAAVTGARRRRERTRLLLVSSDLVALMLAFGLGVTLVGGRAPAAGDAPFILALPAWVMLATLVGLYGVDEQRTDHSTLDDVVRVVELLTLGTWLYVVAAWAADGAAWELAEPVAFWAFALVLLVVGRGAIRVVGRRSASMTQKAVIVGAGDVGQLAARKICQHPEYGIDLLGFVDANPRARRPDLQSVEILGAPERLASIVRSLDVDRVFVAFSEDSPRETVDLLRSLRELDVRIDVVPRLYEVVGPATVVDHLEGLPLVGIPSLRLSRSGQLLKRALDLVVATLALLVLAPLFAVIAVLIKAGSPGPVLFRQTRLGQGMKEFKNLKFRTMHVETGDEEHRAFVRAAMAAPTTPQEGGLFKLSHRRNVTPIGRRLRKTSLDELPQLINVLCGDMSLVGPRPCIPYETEGFAPHHFERFLVPAGLTGLWQVTARARATFAEALEMDVAYVRSYSLAQDLRILLRTPIELLRGNTTT